MAEVEQAASDTQESVTERCTAESLESLDKQQLIEKVLALQERLDSSQAKPDLGAELQSLKESEEKCKQQLAEVTRRETLLLKTLTEKEREINDLASQLDELKQYQLPSNNQLRHMLLDPTVNVVISRLKKELDSTKQRLDDSQSELNAWKFTQDSQIGKQLMARCRTLIKENEELGKQISQGRIAKLEGEIALERKLVEEMKVAQNETEQFVTELDEDTEGLQATVYLLQQQLREAKERISVLEGVNDMTNSNTPTTAETPTDQLTVENNGVDVTAGPPVDDGQTNCAANSVESAMEADDDLTPNDDYKDKKVTPAMENGHTEMMVN